MKNVAEYRTYNIDGQTIVMREKRLPTGLYFCIGTRFCEYARTSDVNFAFDFFNNYAGLVSCDEMSKAWKCYKKATKQRSFGINNAFWNYMDEKKIKRCDRKGHVNQWVSAST